MRALRTRLRQRRTDRRCGAATLDYVLVIGIILPLAAVVIPLGRHMIELVYEMTAVFVSWPFM